jgi:nitronate monooxygenase
MNMETALTRDAAIQVPMICGAMYPCSNPELIAAVSEAGGIGMIQPVSLVYAHGYKFEEGLRKIRALTRRPVGFNAIVEQSSQAYADRMRRWIDIVLEDGVRFFVTALGKPGWVVDLVHAAGGKVYHNVTELKWAQTALDWGVAGLIADNDRAGGHAGERSPVCSRRELCTQWRR